MKELTFKINGQERRELSSKIYAELQQAGVHQQEQSDVSNKELVFGTQSLNISQEMLVHLRNACSHWYAEPGVPKIESHRKFIGPVIVAFKKFNFKIISILLKDFFNRQSNFNSSVIAAMAEMIKEQNCKKIQPNETEVESQLESAQANSLVESKGIQAQEENSNLAANQTEDKFTF